MAKILLRTNFLDTFVPKILTDGREEHDDEAAEHWDAVADPKRESKLVLNTIRP